MDEIVVRVERADDADAVAAVVAEAFDSPAHARLVEELRDLDDFAPELALVAEVDGEVVGHVMVTCSTLVGADGSERPIATLSPLAVRPSHQRRGIGGALVRAVTAAAADRSEPVVVLEGDPAYYGRFGFEPSVPLGVELPIPSWAPPEAAQLLRLPAYQPSLTGRVVYSSPFDAFEE